MPTLETALANYNAGEYATALQDFRRLADGGDPVAMRYLGHLFRDGRGCREDIEEAAQWYLGGWKRQDEGSIESLVELLPQLEKAADAGSDRAQFAVGIIYKYERADLKSGLHWLQKAADQGHCEALRIVGDAYHKGDGIPLDPIRAFDFYKRAADLGNPKSQHQVGRYISEGLAGQSADLERGLSWYRKAADQGFLAANMALCKILAERNRDLNDAREVLQRLQAIAAIDQQHKSVSISSSDGQWAFVVSDGGATVGVSGIDIEDLNLGST